MFQVISYALPVASNCWLVVFAYYFDASPFPIGVLTREDVSSWQSVNLAVFISDGHEWWLPARCGWLWNVHCWVVFLAGAFGFVCVFVEAHFSAWMGLGLHPSVWRAIMAIPAHIANKSKRAGLMVFRRFLFADAGAGSNPRFVRVCVFMLSISESFLAVIQESGG